MEYLKTLKALVSILKISRLPCPDSPSQVFAGGPLSDKNGDKLAAAGVKLFSLYGGTEYGALTKIMDADDSQGPSAPVKTSKDWAWFSFVEERLKMRWDPQGDGTYELHFLVRINFSKALVAPDGDMS